MPHSKEQKDHVVSMMIDSFSSSHTQVSCSPIRRHHKVLNVNGEAMDRRWLSCTEELGLVKIELQVVSRLRLKDVARHREICGANWINC